MCFAGLVALARSLNPIPSRTRPLNSSAPMVLCLKTWESRSPPGLQSTSILSQAIQSPITAGWSSPVARQAHNLKAAGSNPAPATKSYRPNHNHPPSEMTAGDCVRRNAKGAQIGEPSRTDMVRSLQLCPAGGDEEYSSSRSLPSRRAISLIPSRRSTCALYPSSNLAGVMSITP